MGVWVCGCVGRVSKGKRTNESLNDSLVQEKKMAGDGRGVGVWVCGSGAKRKVHQRVVKRLVGVRKGQEAAGEWVCGCAGVRVGFQKENAPTMMNRGALCAPKDAFPFIFAFTKL